MAYRHDRDLEFMDRAKHEDLQNLVFVLTHDPKDGETRWTEELSSKLKGCDDHHFRWQEIAGELQCFGGDTIANMLRGGKGVEYRELLCDVCDVYKVKYDKKALNIEDIENQLVASTFGMLWKNWDSKSRSYIMAISTFFGSPGQFNGNIITSAIRSPALPAVFSAGILGNGLLSVMISQLTTGFATASAAGLGAAAAFSGMSIFALVAPRLAGLFIPATTLFSLLTAALSLSGPAYRVTLPACLAVAALRKKAAMSPREILRVQKLEEIIRKLQAALLKVRSSEEKVISLYVFAYQVMRHFGFDDDESLKGIVFGMADRNMTSDNDLEAKKNVSLEQALANVRSAGSTNEDLANIVMVVGELGDISEEQLRDFIDRYL